MRGSLRPISKMTGQELSGLLSSTSMIENWSVICSSVATSRSHNACNIALPM